MLNTFQSLRAEERRRNRRLQRRLDELEKQINKITKYTDLIMSLPPGIDLTADQFNREGDNEE